MRAKLLQAVLAATRVCRPAPIHRLVVCARPLQPCATILPQARCVHLTPVLGRRSKRVKHVQGLPGLCYTIKRDRRRRRRNKKCGPPPCKCPRQCTGHKMGDECPRGFGAKRKKRSSLNRYQHSRKGHSGKSRGY